MSTFFGRISRRGKKKREKVTMGPGYGNGNTAEASELSPTDDVGPLDLFDDCEGNTSGTDLIFVHGLRGSRLKTWSSGNVLWPRDLLKGDVENARVITWGYDASVANAFTYASKESLFGHAETLLSDLSRLRRAATRPIVFICHSLGGLVVKEALIKSAAYHNHGRHVALGEIYASTIGVIFLGTPHRGSSQATFGEVVTNIAKLSIRQPNEQLLQTLRPDSHILENQRDQFTTISKDLSIVCIREELPTSVGLIVDEASASYDGFNVRRDAIHANHMNMVRFSSKENEGYKRILGHINDIHKDQTRKIQRENEENESRINEILEALQFSTLYYRQWNIENAYTQTCSWILDHQLTNKNESGKESQFLSWLKNEEIFFWISGKAGCGKSTLMKYLYEEDKIKEALCQWADGKELVLIGYFFFDRGDNNQKSREGMLRSILYQALSSRRDLVRKVFGQFFGNNSRLPQWFTSWINLSDAFLSMLDNLQDSKICIFLDGLDEYRMIDRADTYTEEQMDLIYDGTNEDEAWGRSTWITDGHKDISQFLRRFQSHGNVKVCVSSRELVVFEHEFRNYPRLQVHECTEESIAEYCQGRLIDEAPDFIDRSYFVSSITRKSRGVFLWVRLVVDMVVAGYVDGNSKEELLKTIERLSPRLGGKDGLYMRMMQNIEKEYLPESQRLFQLVMQWLEYEHGPLDIITLSLAGEWHLEGDSEKLRALNDEVLLKSWEELQPRWAHLQRRLKSRCGGLLEGTKDVKFMHQTAKEFISRKYLLNKIFRNYAGFVKESDLRLALLSGLIRRLKCCKEAAITDIRSSKYNESSEYDEFHVPKFLREIPLPYRDFHIPFRAFELLASALHCAAHLPDSEDRDYLNHYVVLLDELDKTGNQLIKDWKDALPEPFRSRVTDRSWVEYCLHSDDNERTNSSHLKLESFLELAILYGFFPYVEAKIRGKGFPRSQLQSLLLWATRCIEIKWRYRYENFLIGGGPIQEISEMLLQEGADPNSNVAMAEEEGWTAWTGLLRDAFEGIRSEHWPSTVITFLKYGADPTVRWQRTSTEFAAPEEAINAVRAVNAFYRNDPDVEKDLDNAMEQLHRARLNWGV
ncbi:hypothetical protein EG329_000140 [Mollisiaceae sp. DMI_Dod_QoI]|nr:hypothetical protein EG329_000140 [Helotiales sp. DMI_Dod_QoI]